jgi:hypothetical protein
MKYGIRNALTSMVLASAVALSGCSTLNNSQRDKAVVASIDSWKDYTNTAMNIYKLMENGNWDEAEKALEEELECKPETGPMYRAYGNLNSGEYDGAKSWMKEYLLEQSKFGTDFSDDIVSGKIPSATGDRLRSGVEAQIRRIKEILQ